ncbi:hypothetical protein BKA81DRAFT_360042 [Phyllosticta paracitricarpa]
MHVVAMANAASRSAVISQRPVSATTTAINDVPARKRTRKEKDEGKSQCLLSTYPCQSSRLRRTKRPDGKPSRS